MANLLTLTEVATKLNVKPRTVRGWMEKGKIAYIKLPKGIRFREDWLENWLDKRTIKERKTFK